MRTSVGQLVTGNGFGFQVFDVQHYAVRQFLERPYRYLRPSPTNPDGDGVVRRNLVFDTFFGVQAGGESAWLAARVPRVVEYVDQTNIIRSEVRLGGVVADSYFFAPFGFPGNALVMVLCVRNDDASPLRVRGFSLHNFHLGTATIPDAPDADRERVQFDAAKAP